MTTAGTAPRDLDEAALHRAVESRDPRFDGQVFLAVTSTGIYCRPSCPARRPLPQHRRFYRSAAAAVAAGYRACRLCRPDAVPGSRAWDARADLAARALRLIAAGHVDEHGVSGLAAALHVSDRHLTRVLTAEVGAGPLRLARTRRAQTARLLLDQTALPVADVAFAAGFASVRQFNDVIREEFGATPRQLRGRGAAGAGSAHPADPPGGPLVLRLRVREPFDAGSLLAHLTARAVPGLEEPRPAGLRRPVPTRVGPVVVEVAAAGPGHVTLRAEVPDLSVTAEVVALVRRWWDLDADPEAVGAVLADDPWLAPLVAARPGLRVAGCVAGFELAVRAVVGQQVSVAGARTLLDRLVARAGVPVEGGLRAFPSPASLVAADLTGLGLTSGRQTALRALALAVRDGMDVGPAADRQEVRRALLALPGVGPWTVEYVALRGLGDPDAWPATDLVLRRSLASAPTSTSPERWRPWRGYAAQHLWTAAALSHPPTPPEETP